MAKYEKIGEVYGRKKDNNFWGIAVVIVIVLIAVSQCS